MQAVCFTKSRSCAENHGRANGNFSLLGIISRADFLHNWCLAESPWEQKKWRTELGRKLEDETWMAAQI